MKKRWKENKRPNKKNKGLPKDYSRSSSKWSDEERSDLLREFLKAKKNEILTTDAIKDLSKKFKRHPREIHHHLLNFGILKY